MRIADILGGNLRQQLAQLRAERGRLKRPARPNFDSLTPSREYIAHLQATLSEPEYLAWADQHRTEFDRHIDAYKAAEAKYWRKFSGLGEQIDRLKQQIRYAEHSGTPSAIFTNYEPNPGLRTPSAHIDPIGRLIDTANIELPEPAARAVDAFVGHPARPMQDFGIWNQKRLEDAFSEHPERPESPIIRQQLAHAMEPIQKLLHQRFGNAIPLYRAQIPLTGGEPARRLLSWTANPQFAKHIAGTNRKVLHQEMPLDRIVWMTNRANQQEFICLN